MKFKHGDKVRIIKPKRHLYPNRTFIVKKNGKEAVNAIRLSVNLGEKCVFIQFDELIYGTTGCYVLENGIELSY